MLKFFKSSSLNLVILNKIVISDKIEHTLGWNDQIPKTNIHYTCISVIIIDSIMKIDQKLSSGLSRKM